MARSVANETEGLGHWKRRENGLGFRVLGGVGERKGFGGKVAAVAPAMRVARS